MQTFRIIVNQTSKSYNVTVNKIIRSYVVQANGYKWKSLGDKGTDGINGKSTYELAVDNGFVGTLDAFLLSQKGKDGYTPIKGIDYKDGEKGADGHTPIKGQDYFDGVTPIKGVDYFDGAEGASPYPGVNGNWWTNQLGDTLIPMTGPQGIPGDPTLLIDDTQLLLDRTFSSQHIDDTYATRESLDLKEDLLPITPLNPESKWLNGNKQWAELVMGSGGYASNVYLTNIVSTIDSSYKQTSGTNDLLETIVSTTCVNNEVLIETYLFEQQVGISIIDAGTWKVVLNSCINIAAGDTKFKFTQFKRSITGIETDMFTIYSNSIENKLSQDGYKNNIIESIQPNFTVLPTDRLGCRIYASTTALVNRTIYLKKGDGYASYLNTPLTLRHSQLRDKNGEYLYQHVTTDQINIWTNKQNSLIGNGFVKSANGVISYDNNSYSLTSHTHNYELPLIFSTGLNRIGNTIFNTITQYTDSLARTAQTNESIITALGFTPWYSGNHPTTLLGYGITDASFGNYLPLTGGSMTGDITFDATHGLAFTHSATIKNGLNGLKIYGGTRFFEIEANYTVLKGNQLYLQNINGGAAVIALQGTQSGAKEYDIKNGIDGVSNTGFSIRNYTDSTNPFYIDGSDNTFVKSISVIGGTSSQFLKADGSLDSQTYQPLSTAINTGNIGGQSVNYANNAGSATQWGGYPIDFNQATNINRVIVWDTLDNKFRVADNTSIKSWLGLGSSAYTNTNDHILNQNASAQSANMWISGDVIAQNKGKFGVTYHSVELRSLDSDYGSAMYLYADGGTDQRVYRIANKYSGSGTDLVIDYSDARAYNTEAISHTYTERFRLSKSGDVLIGGASARGFQRELQVKGGSSNVAIGLTIDSQQTDIITSNGIPLKFYDRTSDRSLLEFTTSGAATFASSVNSTGFLLNGNNLTSSLSTNYIPKWNGSTMVNSLISEITNGVEIIRSNGDTYYRANSSSSFCLFGTDANAGFISSNGNLMWYAENGINNFYKDVKIITTTQSSSPTTGALVVGGGIGAASSTFGDNINPPIKWGSTSANYGMLDWFSSGFAAMYGVSGRGLTLGANGQINMINIYNNGNTSIGYTVDQGYKLAVNGTGYFNGAFTALSGAFNSIQLNGANSVSTYNQLNRSSLTNENMFVWRTNSVEKWYLGQRSKNNEDGFSLYSTSFGNDVLYFNPSGNCTFSGNVSAPTFSGQLNVIYGNEATLHNGFAGGAVWINYRGASGAITNTYIGNGLQGGLSQVTASQFNGSGAGLIDIVKSITTNGNSGAASLLNGVLNIPVYVQGSSFGGTYVPIFSSLNGISSTSIASVSNGNAFYQNIGGYICVIFSGTCISNGTTSTLSFRFTLPSTALNTSLTGSISAGVINSDAAVTHVGWDNITGTLRGACTMVFKNTSIIPNGTSVNYSIAIMYN